jgi:hypothetical protein
VFFPTINAFPFSRHHHQPDWRRMSADRAYDGLDIVRAYAPAGLDQLAPGLRAGAMALASATIATCAAGRIA